MNVKRFLFLCNISLFFSALLISQKKKKKKKGRMIIRKQCSNTDNIFLSSSGFSTVLLVEENLTHRKYAVKKIVCHGREDEQLAIKEIEYYNLVKHPNIIKCIDSMCEGTADPIVNTTSEVLILLPYYHVG